MGMFYRRKVLLSLLQLFGDELEKIRLQKLLFLFTQRQTKKEYDFVPYKFGCFSFSANADLTAMARQGLINETQTSFVRQDNVNYLQELNAEDVDRLQTIKATFGNVGCNELIRYTYLHYPYWAINSTIADSLLTASEKNVVLQCKPKSQKTILFTIGYEGISLEEYLNRLIVNDVNVLVDVRCNPLSMKYGFSKNQLQRNCESLGIRYAHFPEVGIRTDQRQNLNGQDDYDKLFARYTVMTLPQTHTAQYAILDLLATHRRIALTCFEVNINQCHRKHLAEAIARLSTFDYDMRHI